MMKYDKMTHALKVTLIQNEFTLGWSNPGAQKSGLVPELIPVGAKFCEIRPEWFSGWWLIHEALKHEIEMRSSSPL